MLLRWIGIALGTACPTLAMAELPVPPSCERLHMVVDGSLLQQAGLDPANWPGRLEQSSGLQLQLYPVDAEARAAFNAGALDLWLAADVKAQQTAVLLQPPVWQERLRLWVRAGELTRVDQWPQLNGLRGGYQDALLIREALSEMGVATLDSLASLPLQEAAQTALLEGEIDYMVTGADGWQALQQAAKEGQVEALQPELVLHSYHLAFSRNSVCLDEQVRVKLEKGLLSALRSE